MKIEVYCLANNEELLMPYFMRHYGRFADVIILESCSTDRTIQIAHDMGAEVWSYDMKDELNDQWFTYLKNTCWKDSKADWVMIADADEFIYHLDLVNILKSTDATVIRPRFYDMYSKKFPTTEGQIYDEVTMGVEQLAPNPKMNIFRPVDILDMNYAPGCHDASPSGNVKIDIDTEIKTLHMRNLSLDYYLAKNQRHSQRRSQVNKDNHWGDHVDLPKEDMIRKFVNGIENAVKVI
jgi:glycosyltransferase involved in cell wall biosynthesis